MRWRYTDFDQCGDRAGCRLHYARITDREYGKISDHIILLLLGSSYQLSTSYLKSTYLKS